MSTSALVGGDVEVGFGRVADEFRRNFTSRGEVGAALAVYRDGKPLVDLWGGTRDTTAGLAWQVDTMVPVFSTSKGVSAFVLGALHSRGLLDHDVPVTDYWPEFGQAGKQDTTVRQLLAHQAGLAVLDSALRAADLLDLDAVAATIAAQPPLWAPGTRTAYHAITLGLYENELARRVDPAGRSIGRILAEDFAGPLGLRIHIGLPDDVDMDEIAVLGRLGPLALVRQLRSAPIGLARAMRDPTSVLSRSLGNPRLGRPDRFARRTVLAPECPASNGVADARSLAKLYGLAAIGAEGFPVGAATLGAFARPVEAVRDAALLSQRAYSLGFSKPTPAWPFGSPGGHSYGTAGLGGSFGFADPFARIGFGYTPNRLGISLTNDPRDAALRKALYRCL